jgi:hypothetical protein
MNFFCGVNTRVFPVFTLSHTEPKSEPSSSLDERIERCGAARGARHAIEALMQDTNDERTFAWLNQFRRLRVRYDKRGDIHEAFLSLGCAMICWQSLCKTLKWTTGEIL